MQALINNAGRIPGEERELAKDGSTESAFAIMANGTFLLTGLLRPVSLATLRELRSSSGSTRGRDRQAFSQGQSTPRPDAVPIPAQAYVKGSRVVNVSSGGMYTCGLRADNFQLQKHYTPLLAYAHSKRAQVILSEQWAERLRKDGVVVSSMHPGWALTEGVRDQLDGFKAGGKLRSPAEGADTIVWLVRRDADGTPCGPQLRAAVLAARSCGSGPMCCCLSLRVRSDTRRLPARRRATWRPWRESSSLTGSRLPRTCPWHSPRRMRPPETHSGRSASECASSIPMLRRAAPRRQALQPRPGPQVPRAPMLAHELDSPPHWCCRCP